MLPTVFSDDGQLDLEAIPALVEHGLAQGIDGFALMGLAAEVRNLTPDERKLLIEHTLQAIDGRCPTIIGASADDTATAVALTRHAGEFGAQMVMVAPPAVKSLSDADQEAHFIAVAKAAPDSQIMLQDAPNELGVALSPATIAHIVEAAPNVRYAKLEGVNTGQAVSNLLATDAGRLLTFFAGTGGLHYMDLLDAGATGVIPAFEAPGAFGEITRRFAAGDVEGARAIHRKLMPFLVFKAQSLAVSIVTVKELLKARGLIRSAHARNAPPLGDWSRKIVLSLAGEAGLLDNAMGLR